MQVMELAGTQEDGWRYIAIALIDPWSDQDLLSLWVGRVEIVPVVTANCPRPCAPG
jgi:hypothetical protein